MDGQDRYLQNLIRSAPPARLRLLLIERGIEVAESLAASTPTRLEAVRPAASDGKPVELVRAEQMIRLREILGELLNGVVNKELQVAKQVADLYVFLLQFLNEAEREDKSEQWEQLAQILRLERETWSEVCAQFARPANASTESRSAVAVSDFGTEPPVVGSLNLQG